MASPKTVQSTVAFQDSQGNVVANGSLVLTLSQSAEITSGGGLVAPKTVTLALGAGGLITGTPSLWANDQLTPSGTTYGAELLDSGGNILANFGQWNVVGASPIDLSQMIPVSTSTVSNPAPVLLSPSGNQTITSGNLTLATGNFSAVAGAFSGAITGGANSGSITLGTLTTGTFNNSCVANNQVGADLGAKINTCLALGNNTDIMITAGGTISTQVVINNLTNVRIRGQGAWGTNINNGITGAGAICAMKITGTSSAIILDNFQILGNTLTGASGNGNGICIYGTGANPSNIYFTNMSVQGNKGTGLDGTSTSMPAAGIYVYKAIDISFVGGGYGGNQLGMVFDNSVNNVQVEKQGIFGNTTGGIKIINTGGSIEIGPNNDIEGNGALTTDFWFLMDSCIGCSMHHNFVQSNSGEMLIKDTFTPTQFALFNNILIHGGSGSSPNLSWMLDSTANVNLDIHDNWINMQQSMTNLIDITPSTNATVYKRIANNNFNFTAGGAVSNHGINWQGGNHVGPCVIEGNVFGDPTNSTFTGGSAIATGATTSGCRVMNNGCATASGTLTNCVQVETGATNTVVSGTTKSGAGTVTNLVNDGGTNTICIGQGCAQQLTVAGTIKTNNINITNLLTSVTAPTIAGAGCGGTLATIATNNGTASFSINVGTAPTSAGCVVTMPSATNGWNCAVTDITTNSTSVFVQKQTAAGSSATQVTLVNYSDIAAATAPVANDIWQVSCFAR